MKRTGYFIWLCTVLMAWQGGSVLATAAPLPKPTAVDTCIDQVRDKAFQQVTHGLSPEAGRRLLEIGVVACQHPRMGPNTAAFIGTVNADLARFGHDFLQGKLTGLAYRNARLDRSRKLQAFRDDIAFHKALIQGDADGDLVPDSRDRCPHTPDGTPTDDAGCPVPGTTQPPGGDAGLLRRLLDNGQILHNDACQGAPEPLSPQPFKYGRTNTNNPIPVGSFKLVLAQVGGMPQECELFYEIQFHFIEPVDVQASPSKDVNVVFREGEDLASDLTLAVFGLPVGTPLSPGRTAALDALKIYQRVTWRVRAVNGSAHASPWSPFVTQGPVSGGIP
jgi:hypothetical protein